ncbi:hypothetical protein [Streptomyces sp. NPDC056244]|uniref:hypothetical protein n=1 Tax=Streptomyces sp. NPDC056244 TaxID=3345762 RepID=UPI0035E2B53F
MSGLRRVGSRVPAAAVARLVAIRVGVDTRCWSQAVISGAPIVLLNAFTKRTRSD